LGNAPIRDQRPPPRCHQTGRPQRLIARNVHLDQLPVPQLTLDMNEQGGLESLAYEFSMDDMTEVLAGLSARHGKPISTSIKEDSYEDQLW